MATVDYYSLSQLIADLEALIQKDPQTKVAFKFELFRKLTYTGINTYEGATVDKDFNTVRLRDAAPSSASTMLTNLKDIAGRASGPVLIQHENAVSILPCFRLEVVYGLVGNPKGHTDIMFNPYHVLSTLKKDLEDANVVTVDGALQMVSAKLAHSTPIDVSLFLVGTKWYLNQATLQDEYPLLVCSGVLNEVFTKETVGKITVYTTVLAPDEMKEVFGKRDDRLKELLEKKKDAPLVEVTKLGGIVTTKKYSSAVHTPETLESETVVYTDRYKSITYFTDGKKTRKLWEYPGGMPNKIYHYKDGLLSGLHQEFNEKGTLAKEGNYFHDMCDGIWTYAETQEKILYNQGILLDRFCYPLKVVAFKDNLLQVDRTPLIVEKLSSGTYVLVGVNGNGKVDPPTKEDEARARFRDIKVLTA